MRLQAGGGRRTVRVRLQHVSGLMGPTDPLFVLTCIFPDHVTSSTRAGAWDLMTSHKGAVSVTSLNAKEESLQTSESSTQSVRFHQPPPPPPPPQDTHVDGRHTGALLSTAGLLQHDGLRTMAGEKPDMTSLRRSVWRQGQALPSSSSTSSMRWETCRQLSFLASCWPWSCTPETSIMSISMAVTFGAVAVTRCQVTNPLGNEGEELEAKVIDKGCGTDDVLPKSATFRRSRHGLITPLFAVPEMWTRGPALVCPTTFATSISPGIHDVAVTLESQVVTPCPLTEQLGGEGLSPPGCDLGFEVPLPSAVGEKDANNNNNNTASMTSPLLQEGSWLAQHLHYLLIICVLGIFIVVFMSATFLKMAAMQRYTARPLPSVPSTRRGGRRDEDGTSTAVVQARHSQAMTPTTTSTVLTSESSAFIYPELPDGGQVQPVWVPVSHSPTALKTFSMPPVHSFSQPVSSSSGMDSAHEHLHHVNVIEVTAQPQVVEVRGHSKPASDVVEVTRETEGEEDKRSSWSHDFFAPKPSSFSGRGGTVLGVNSLKRSLERDGYFTHRGNLTAGRDLAMTPGCAPDGAVIARQSRDTGRAELGVAVVSPDHHRSTHHEHHRSHQDPHKPLREPQPHQDPHKPHSKQQPHQQTGTIAQETTRL
ncbi:hypothetical protein C0Q70_18940 [Pomacea canaliculata]|uniref:Uncharacterized protein n=1 Tax=Pomacea canaliculata TaxID=400727 RepID=A0A2T7NHX8_POMCA|nr:hypothetical protein C0Q70_18940 [Pomacea canaliculata]